MTTQSEMLQLLQTATRKAVEQSSVANWIAEKRISYVSVRFNVPNDSKYLEIVHVPNDEDYFLSGQQPKQGILRLILHWPKDGSGAYEPYRLIEEIASFFSIDTRQEGFQVSGEPKINQTLVLDKEILYPATIRYRTC